MTWRRTTDAQGRALVHGEVIIRPSSFVDHLTLAREGGEAVVELTALWVWASLYRVPLPSAADLAWVTA